MGSAPFFSLKFQRGLPEAITIDWYHFHSTSFLNGQYPFHIFFLFGLVLGLDPDWSENSDTDPEYLIPDGSFSNLYILACYCGKCVREVVCTAESAGVAVYSCGETCEKSRDCEQHQCDDACHPGPCRPCLLTPTRVTRSAHRLIAWFTTKLQVIDARIEIISLFLYCWECFLITSK